MNYRVQAIGTDGKVRWVYGQPLPADAPIQYNGPDRKFGAPSEHRRRRQRRLYVVDGLNGEVVVLNTSV